MERCEIDLFGRNEFVIRLVSHVFDVVDDERVVQRVLRKEDDLCAAGREGSDCSFAYTRCAALENVNTVLAYLPNRSLRSYSHHHDFAVHIPLSQSPGSLEESLQEP